MKKAILALEDGRVFHGQSFTGEGEAFGEIVFNTGMTGYQEILTDPSYRGQMITMTYPLIGNYGINKEDSESNQIQAAAFIIKEYQSIPSNYRSTETLANYLSRGHVIGIENIDTRALTRHIRLKGAMRAGISTIDTDPVSLIQRIKQTPTMEGLDLAKVVSSKKPYRWYLGKPVFEDTVLNPSIWYSSHQYHRVVVLDFGIKYNILRCLEHIGCEIFVVPGNTSADTIKKMAPDGIFLSNGPGDPEPVTYAIDTIKHLLTYKPIFGICLGHQLMGLALGGHTYKLKFGHRGANQPVKYLPTGRVEITSQNHGFAVKSDSLPNDAIEITHLNLNDQTVEGFRHKTLPLFAVQYHPEASPGPHDARYLFDHFKILMNNERKLI